jgi:hypothetical protein
MTSTAAAGIYGIAFEPYVGLWDAAGPVLSNTYWPPSIPIRGRHAQVYRRPYVGPAPGTISAPWKPSALAGRHLSWPPMRPAGDAASRPA